MTAAIQTEARSETASRQAQATPATTRSEADRLFVACSIIAAGLLVIAFFLPLWVMNMSAPQYPQGLQLTAYGTKMNGDLEEINSLNHYVGVKEIEPGSVAELKLFPVLLFALVAVLIVSPFFVRWRYWRALLAAAVFAVPIGMLADIQWWLYKYGHDRSEDAIYDIADFTPRVLGGTQVINFHTDTMVATGWWVMVAAGIVIAFGPPVVRFLAASWSNTEAAPSETAG